MARIDYWQYMVDREGRPLEDAQVRVYLAGTLIEANIFLHPEFGSFTISSAEDLKTNKYGFVQFWMGDEWEVEGGYTVDQQFKIVWQNDVDGYEQEIDKLYVLSPLRPIEIGNDIIGQQDNKDLNRVISNKQGHKWNTHVDSIVPSSSPHDLEPVVLFDLSNLQNKVISNKLGYQMYEMASTASITPLDVSAARFYSERITTWSTSGGLYYKAVSYTHLTLPTSDLV